ncbi:MAG: hypothetical protein N4A71_22130 [Carboxylicivirga sp.]|jgi:hypothetical protein|nr:hypothetical protein [Carboxylicivirga sp.]
MKLTEQDIKELEAVEQRIAELHSWLNAHNIFHSEYEQQCRNLSIAIYKQIQIKARSQRASAKLPKTYSLPTNNY